MGRHDCILGCFIFLFFASATDRFVPNRRANSQVGAPQVPEFPDKVFFYCEVEPAQGGETPILLSHRVYDRMAQAFPDFVTKLEKDGLLYIRVLGEGDDASSPIGRGWRSTFLTEDIVEADKRY